MTTFNDITYKHETCNAYIHIHSSTKQNLSEKHIENLDRVQTQNITNESQIRREFCKISVKLTFLLSI